MAIPGIHEEYMSSSEMRPNDRTLFGATLGKLIRASIAAGVRSELFRVAQSIEAHHPDPRADIGYDDYEFRHPEVPFMPNGTSTYLNIVDPATGKRPIYGHSLVVDEAAQLYRGILYGDDEPVPQRADGMVIHELSEGATPLARLTIPLEDDPAHVPYDFAVTLWPNDRATATVFREYGMGGHDYDPEPVAFFPEDGKTPFWLARPLEGRGLGRQLTDLELAIVHDSIEL